MVEAVLLFPGQGSQYVGMGKSFYDAYPSVRRLFEEACDVTGKDLRALCFDGPDAVLVQTDNVQPAITLVNLACLDVLRAEGVEPVAVAGHSLGEYAALVAAGALSVADAMRLVAIRGAAMKEAAARHPGGMTAVFGLDRQALAGICAEVRDAGSVEVANHNSLQQVVLTGEKPAVQAAASLAKQRGAKLVAPLNVSGPWHSRFMTEAVAPVREALEQIAVAAPAIPVVANVTGRAYPADPAAIRAGLVEQIVKPVLWADSVRGLVEASRRTFIECGPGKVLAGLMRDISRDVTIVGVQDTTTLAKARAAWSGAAA